MTPKKIQDALASLSTRRPLFHSEADFQHALAWEIQSRHARTSIRLEKQVGTNKDPMHLDLLVCNGQKELAIEVKYKTRALTATHAGEKFALRNQSAQDIGRYDFIKDISRLEKYVGTRASAAGCAIFLTNDWSYWMPPKKADPVDLDFRFDAGQVKKGTLRWGHLASRGTTHNRELPIRLNGKYPIDWSDYSELDSTGAERFRYVAIWVSNAA